MGPCGSKDSASRNKKVPQMHCPICEEQYDRDEHESLIICSNNHKLCRYCLQSIKAQAVLRRQPQIKCPFCKVKCEESLMVPDQQLNEFLKQQEQTLRQLPENRRKLYAFASTYLPKLKKYLKESVEQVGVGSHLRNKPQHIQTIRIQGRMSEEDTILHMQIFDCLPNLSKLYLDKNKLKAIQPLNYYQQSLSLLSLIGNQITSCAQILGPSKDCLANLKVLHLGHNKITEVNALDNITRLEVLDLNNNLLKSFKGLEKAMNLTHLNLENNQIGGEWVDLPCFDWIHSLQLFGNKLKPFYWQKIIRRNWQQLRFLTVTVQTQDIIEKQQLYQQIYKIKQQVLQFIIFESFYDEEENFQEFNIYEPGIKFVQIYGSSYQLHLEQDLSFINKAIKVAKTFHPCGQNMNFRINLTEFNSLLYKYEAGTYTFTKMDHSSDLTELLYSFSLPMFVTSSPSKFISFWAKDMRIGLGVCQFMAGGEGTVDLDLENRIVTSDIVGQIPFDHHEVRKSAIDQLRSSYAGGSAVKRQRSMNQIHERSQEEKIPEEQPEVEMKEHQILLSFDLSSMDLRLWVDGVMWHSMTIPNSWNEYRFYINLKHRGASARIIRFDL